MDLPGRAWASLQGHAAMGGDQAHGPRCRKADGRHTNQVGAAEAVPPHPTPERPGATAVSQVELVVTRHNQGSNSVSQPPTCLESSALKGLPQLINLPQTRAPQGKLRPREH